MQVSPMAKVGIALATAAVGAGVTYKYGKGGWIIALAGVGGYLVGRIAVNGVEMATAPALNP